MTRPPVLLTEPWERLAWAREQRYETAAEAARGLGMKEGTYRAYERRPDSSKSTRLDYETAQLFARKFGVNSVWLLKGLGGHDDPERLDDQDELELLAIFRALTAVGRRQLIEIAKTFRGPTTDDLGSFLEAAEPDASFEPAPPATTRKRARS